MIRPRRVIYNFVERCNMACTFCYVPFDGRPGEERTALAVLDRVLAWNIESLVIGGGDPLMYGYTTRLIGRARRVLPNLFIQLDTNVHRASCERVAAVANQVDLIGLPVDAIRRKVCAAMRRRATHGAEVLDLVRCLAELGHAVKVNTVVSRVNRLEIPRVRRAVEQSGARIWSLYEFWPIGDVAVGNADAHRITAEEYRAVIRHQRRWVRGTLVIESSGGITERAGAYFFIAPTGRAFCTTLTGDRFIELGSLLEDERGVLDRWCGYVDMPRNAERAAQRVRILGHDQRDEHQSADCGAQVGRSLTSRCT